LRFDHCCLLAAVCCLLSAAFYLVFGVSNLLLFVTHKPNLQGFVVNETVHVLSVITKRLWLEEAHLGPKLLAQVLLQHSTQQTVVSTQQTAQSRQYSLISMPKYFIYALHVPFPIRLT
jgi:hypothetical protein